MKKSELKQRIKELEDELFEARVEAATYKRLYEQGAAPQQPWWPTTSPTTPVWQPEITYTEKMHTEAEDLRNSFTTILRDKA